MSRWVDLGALADLRFAPGAPVHVGGRWLAVFPFGDGWRAIDNACPHASAPLCDGHREGDTITCFLHLWSFDLATGACSVGPEWSVGTYDVRRRGDRLEVELPDA